MLQIPRDSSLDSTFSLLTDPYRFISKRCQQYKTKAFETRIMFQKALCMQGEEASKIFNEPGRFARQDAMPITALKLLQDKGSVHTLEGEAHRWRKQMFMSLMKPEKIQDLSDLTSEQWFFRMENWTKKKEIALLDEVPGILCRAVCRWAGLSLSEVEAKLRTQEFVSMVSGAGAVGPRNLWGILMRAQTENWAENTIEKVRNGKIEAPEGRALHTIAWHRDREGKLLDRDIAAVELINVLRPVVANAWYVTFAALALHEYPECKQKVHDGDSAYLEAFVQEVRRFYPFFPAIGGRALESFEWQGIRVDKGAWVLLDIYGTNHDSDIWGDPEVFRPERFLEQTFSPYSLIPQGGGDPYKGHRCAGEWISIELMKRTTHILVRTMEYEVPAQKLQLDFSSIPAIPKSRFLMRNIRSVISEPIEEKAGIAFDGYDQYTAFDFPGMPPLVSEPPYQGTSVQM